MFVGDRVASYKELGYKSPVTDVDFHPHEHMVAFCSYGENHPVLVYKYDHAGEYCYILTVYLVV